MRRIRTSSTAMSPCHRPGGTGRTTVLSRGGLRQPRGSERPVVGPGGSMVLSHVASPLPGVMLLALSTIVLALPSGRPGDLLSSWSTVRQAVNACGNRSCSMGIVSMLVDSQILITNGTNVHLFSAPGQRAELIGGASRFFLVSNGAKLTLTGIILTSGSAPLRGGAVKVMGGSTLNLMSQTSTEAVCYSLDVLLK